MKTDNYFDKSSVSQRITNAKGKYSTQFMMSGYIRNENPSIKKNLEDSVKMGGYEVQDRKPVMSQTDMQQPMGRHSEFWIG